ncbi:hypothetical protein BTUL_0098g00010 [Botrytis tulipae]|uniref:Uncharacterized protein n=1 Tax=Botrytis tulipae TaxID=87230 RepID=A0A4Z1ERX6_9HELO|nr:hypothetical protein BTUL_0098g00010 [Botrytis tulipae]
MQAMQAIRKRVPAMSENYLKGGKTFFLCIHMIKIASTVLYITKLTSEWFLIFDGVFTHRAIGTDNDADADADADADTNANADAITAPSRRQRITL